MINFFKSLFTNKHIKNNEYDDVSGKNLLALSMATSDTINIANDVSHLLKDRIDDYTKQIDITGKLLDDSLITFDDDGNIITYNDKAEFIFGKSKLDNNNFFMLFERNNCEINTVDSIISCTIDNNDIALYDNGLRAIDKNNKLLYIDMKISTFIKSDGKKHHISLLRDVTNLKESEKKIKSLLDHQTAIYDAMPDMILIIDKKANVKSVNKPKNFKDKNFDETSIGRNIYDFLKLDKAKFIHDNILKANDEIILTEYTHIIEDICYYFEARYVSCGDDIMIICRDITDIKKKIIELKESEQHFKSFGQASTEAMIIHDMDNIMEWNTRLNEISGYSNEEIRYMKPIDFIHPLEREIVHNLLNKDIMNNYETLLLTKEGKPIEVSINGDTIERNQEKAKINVIRDLSSIKNIEKVLNISRERYNTVAENTIDLICCYDKNFDITFANQAFMAYFNISNDKLSNFMNFVSDKDENNIRQYIDSITKEIPVKRTLHKMYRSSTEFRWIDWIDRLVVDDNGNFIEIQSIGRDVTNYIDNNIIRVDIKRD